MNRRRRACLRAPTLQQLYRIPACAGECGTALPLHMADGTLVLDETYLTLPPGTDATRELAGARACVARP